MGLRSNHLPQARLWTNYSPLMIFHKGKEERGGICEYMRLAAGPYPCNRVFMIRSEIEFGLSKFGFQAISSEVLFSD